ncbi:MAG: NADH-quinone oxidoreductase subunit J [Gemmatales bacterium]
MAKFFSWLVAYWYLMVPLVLGFLAIVTLLPHVGKRKVPVQAGLAASVLALLLTGLLIIRTSGNLALDLFFYAFAGITLASAGATIVQRNPVYSALYFAITVLGVCGLYLVKSASFLAAATIIVYAGAIIVTFLFVIMLAQQSGLADYDRRSREHIFATVAGFVLLAALLFIIEKNFSPKSDPKNVVAVLKDVSALTAADRYPQKGRDVIETLQAGNTEAQMLKMFDHLGSWPDATTQKAEAVKAWSAARTLLQDNKAPQAHASLAKLYEIATQLELAYNRYSGILSVTATNSPAQSKLSARSSDARIDHVNELGRSLFGDYLYAVELAGTLLLVATIAAILIAQEPRKKVLA